MVVTGDANGRENPFEFYTMSPVTKAGYAFLGDVSNLIPISPTLVQSIEASASGMVVSLTGVSESPYSVGFLTPDQTVAFKTGVCDSSGTARAEV